MENIEANLKRVNLLAEKIGFEKIWAIQATEFRVEIYTYANKGVEDILKSLKFEKFENAYVRFRRPEGRYREAISSLDYIYKVSIQEFN